MIPKYLNKYVIELKFVRDILGSSVADVNIQEKYIKTKMMQGKTGMSAEISQSRLDEENLNNKNDDELIKELKEMKVTIFYRNEKGKVCIADHQIKGWIKENFAFLGKANKWLTKKDGESYSGDTAFKSWISKRLYLPKRWYDFKEEVSLTDIPYDRPLRVMTPLGERTSIASSERISILDNPKGVTLEIEIYFDKEVAREMIEQVFERGIMNGIGQWHNAQFGTFEYKIIE